MKIINVSVCLYKCIYLFLWFLELNVTWAWFYEVPSCNCMLFWGSCLLNWIFCLWRTFAHSCVFSSQTGGGSRGSVHSYQKTSGRWGRDVAQAPPWGDGPSRGGPGHLRPNGTSHAEVPAYDTPAALPQHGEHHRSLAVLHHSQHDAQGDLNKANTPFCYWDTS